MKKKLIWIAIAIVIMMTLKHFNRLQFYRYEEQTQRLGTLAQLVVVLPENSQSRERAEELFQMAYDEIDRLDRIFSRYRKDSELSFLNEQSGQFVTVSEELGYVLQRALEISAQTEGAFDVTIFPLLKLWWQATESNRVPSQEKIKKVLEQIGYQSIEWDLTERKLRVPSGFQIDLGGIAKGYVIERIRDIWVQAGVKHSLINIGGDLWAMGHNERMVPWKLAIQDPNSLAAILQYVELSDVGMVTSGDYHRTFDIEGHSYSHIIDPRTGWPTEGAASITLIGSDMIEIDAYATAVSVIGSSASQNILDQHPDWRYQCMFQDKELVRL